MRRGIGGLMLLVALLGIDARAATSNADAMPQMVADADMMSHRMPVMGDCTPCAYCYSGPALTIQGFSGESKEREPSAWTALASAASSPRRFVDVTGRRSSLLPVRVAYCRWSN